MSDDKHIQDGRDRSKVSGSEDYEVRYLADKFGIGAEEVRQIIVEVGNDREKVEARIKKMSK